MASQPTNPAPYHFLVAWGLHLGFCLSLASCFNYDNLVVLSSTEMFQITASGATAQSNLADLSEDLSQHGHCWAITPNPDIAIDERTELGTKTDKGAFVSALTDLRPGTLYYIRAYAVANGEVYYGRENSFETGTITGTLKELSTLPPSNITSSTAIVQGEVNFGTNTLLTEHGHCWSVDPMPSTDNARTQLGQKTNNGAFISNITDLAPATRYFLRAYVVSNQGTFYSNEVQFVTASN